MANHGRSARELRRVSSILDSPVVTAPSQALGATTTIKAYRDRTLLSPDV